MYAAALFSEGADAAASADVDYYCGIAFEANPGDYLGDSAFTDLSDRLADHTAKHGRQHELDRLEAGTASFLFRNADAALDPSNTGSEYYPGVKPMRPIRCFRHIDGTRYPIFDGLIERFEPDWVVGRNDAAGQAGYQNIVIQAVDAFEILNHQFAVDGTYASVVMDPGAGANDIIVWTAVNSGVAGITVDYAYPASDPNATVDVTVADKAVTVIMSTDGGGFNTATANDVLAAVAASPEASALITGALPSGGSGAGLINFEPATELVGVSGWPSELTGARVARVLDAIDWPSQLRSVDAGQYDIVGAYFELASQVVALAHMQEVADSEFGYVFVDASGNVVFHDGDHRATATRSTVRQAWLAPDGDSAYGTSYTYRNPKFSYDLDKIFNDAIVTAGQSTSIPQRWQDADLQTQYLRRQFTKSTLLQDDADALQVAYSVIVRATVQTLYVMRLESIELVDTGAAGWEDTVLLREIGDYVTIKFQSPGDAGLGGLYGDYWIESITHQRAPGQPHTVRWSLTQKY